MPAWLQEPVSTRRGGARAAGTPPHIVTRFHSGAVHPEKCHRTACSGGECAAVQTASTSQCGRVAERRAPRPRPQPSLRRPRCTTAPLTSAAPHVLPGSNGAAPLATCACPTAGPIALRGSASLHTKRRIGATTCICHTLHSHQEGWHAHGLWTADALWHMLCCMHSHQAHDERHGSTVACAAAPVRALPTP